MPAGDAFLVARSTCRHHPRLRKDSDATPTTKPACFAQRAWPYQCASQRPARERHAAVRLRTDQHGPGPVLRYARADRRPDGPQLQRLLRPARCDSLARREWHLCHLPINTDSASSIPAFWPLPEAGTASDAGPFRPGHAACARTNPTAPHCPSLPLHPAAAPPAAGGIACNRAA